MAGAVNNIGSLSYLFQSLSKDMNLKNSGTNGEGNIIKSEFNDYFKELLMTPKKSLPPSTRKKTVNPIISPPRNIKVDPIISPPRKNIIDPIISKPRNNIIDPIISPPKNNKVDPIISPPKTIQSILS